MHAALWFFWRPQCRHERTGAYACMPGAHVLVSWMAVPTEAQGPAGVSSCCLDDGRFVAIQLAVGLCGAGAAHAFMYPCFLHSVTGSRHTLECPVLTSMLQAGNGDALSYLIECASTMPGPESTTPLWRHQIACNAAVRRPLPIPAPPFRTRLAAMWWYIRYVTYPTTRAQQQPLQQPTTGRHHRRGNHKHNQPGPGLQLMDARSPCMRPCICICMPYNDAKSPVTIALRHDPPSPSRGRKRPSGCTGR